MSFENPELHVHTEPSRTEQLVPPDGVEKGNMENPDKKQDKRLSGNALSEDQVRLMTQGSQSDQIEASKYMDQATAPGAEWPPVVQDLDSSHAKSHIGGTEGGSNSANMA